MRLGTDDAAADTSHGDNLVLEFGQDACRVAVGSVDDCVGFDLSSGRIHRPQVIFVTLRGDGIYRCVGLKVDACIDGFAEEVRDQLVWPQMSSGVRRCTCGLFDARDLGLAQ